MCDNLNLLMFTQIYNSVLNAHTELFANDISESFYMKFEHASQESVAKLHLLLQTGLHKLQTQLLHFSLTYFMYILVVPGNYINGE